MAKDFAKPHRTAPEEQGRQGSPRWVWFVTGFTLGSFLSFLGALWLMVPSEDANVALVEEPKPGAEVRSDDMQWDFYEIFPKSVVPIVEEYQQDGEKVVVDDSRWILQAGSFQDPADADERRAELILLGLTVTTTTVDMEGKTWHRVIVGPFDKVLERNRAQDKLAQAQIQSIPIRLQGD